MKQVPRAEAGLFPRKCPFHEQSLELRSTYPAAAPHSHLGVPLCSPLRSPPRWSLPSLGEAQEWIPPKRLGEAPHHLPHVLMVGSKGIPAQQAFQREARGLFRLRENGSEIFQTPVFNIPWGSVSKIFTLIGPNWAISHSQ